MKRKVIIHNHLFKNAGTTFDGCLKQNFGDAFCDHRDDAQMRKEGFPYLIDYLRKNQDIKALSSHHIWFQLEPDDEIELIPVFFIRHPIERILSVYHFEKNQKANTTGAEMAKKLSFQEYVGWLMRNDSPATIRNFQTRRLAGMKKPIPVTENHYNLAKQQILENEFIGVVDRFEESLHLFSQKFKKIGIDLAVDSYISQNINPDFRQLSQKEKIDKCLNELGEMKELALEKNQYDLKIYDLAVDKLSEQLNRSI